MWADATNDPPDTLTAVPAQDILRAYLEVQVQLQATQHALERNRQEAEAAAARNAEMLDTRLRLLEQALDSERTRALDSMERSQRLMLVFAGAFAGLGLLAIVLSAYMQWRSTERLASLGGVLRALPTPSQVAPFASLGSRSGQLPHSETPELVNARLLGVIEKLERQIQDMEQTARPAVTAPSPLAPTPDPSGSVTDPTTETAVNGEGTDRRAQMDLLLAKGQTLLDLGRAEEALSCFDDALKFDPEHPEVLVKRGAALEQTRQPDEALACYDRAIAADGSFTLAYLQKGGLCNRLERYDEALKCYEEALKSQEKNGGTG